MRARFILAAALAAVTIATAAPQAAGQTCYVQRNGATFRFQGGDYRFVGVNLRGTHYLSDAEIDEQVSSASAMGARVIRLFLPKRSYTGDQAVMAQRLSNFLARTAAINASIKVLVAFTDFYQSDFILAADNNAGYYNRAAGGQTVLGFEWFRTQFRNYYKPLVLYIVGQFKNDGRIFGWELGNEFQGQNATDMLNFAYEMGQAIKAADSNHMVSTGFIGVNHAINGAGDVNDTLLKMYSSYNSQATPFGFGSIHAYNNEQAAPDANACTQKNPQHTYYDINWFVANNFPYIVGEGGFDGAFSGGNPGCGGYFNADCYWEGTLIPNAVTSRQGALSATLTKFFNSKSADGYLQWGLMAGTDNGEGDRCSGLDSAFHTDWTTLRSLYSSWASSLPAGGTTCACPAVTTTTPASATVCAGSSRTFSVTAGGGNGTYAYQWYEWNCTGSCSWKPVGTNSPSFTTNLVRTFYVRVTSCGQSVNSGQFSLANYPATTTTTPASATVCPGSSKTFTVSPGGGNGSYSYQWWEWNCTGSCSWKPVGANSSSYTTNLVRTFYTTVTSCGQGANTGQFSLANYPAVTTTTPGSVTVPAGTYYTFSVTAGGGNGAYTYKWYEWNCTGGCSWKQVGTNSRSYTTNLVRTYYVNVSSCGTAQSVNSGMFSLAN